APIRGGEEITIRGGMAEVEREPEHRLAVGPIARAERVPGCNVKPLAVARDAARRPDAAAPAAGSPGGYVGGIAQRNADHPAVIVAAIPEKPAIGHIERA